MERRAELKNKTNDNHIKKNRAATLIAQSPKYSNRIVTKKTAQLQSNHKVQPESNNPLNSSIK